MPADSKHRRPDTAAPLAARSGRRKNSQDGWDWPMPRTYTGAFFSSFARASVVTIYAAPPSDTGQQSSRPNGSATQRDGHVVFHRDGRLENRVGIHAGVVTMRHRHMAQLLLGGAVFVHAPLRRHGVTGGRAEKPRDSAIAAARARIGGACTRARIVAVGNGHHLALTELDATDGVLNQADIGGAGLIQRADDIGFHAQGLGHHRRPQLGKGRSRRLGQHAIQIPRRQPCVLQRGADRHHIERELRVSGRLSVGRVAHADDAIAMPQIFHHDSRSVALSRRAMTPSASSASISASLIPSNPPSTSRLCSPRSG